MRMTARQVVICKGIAGQCLDPSELVPLQKNPTILAGVFCWKPQQRGQGRDGHKH